MFANIYKGRKILVTGHTGFEGSWLSAWLISLGADIYGFSLNPTTKPSAFEVLNLHDKLQDVRGDIRDLSRIKEVITKYEPEVVFHLAGKDSQHRSFLEPVETFSTNIMGVVNLLESIRQSSSVKVAVVITSDKCYYNKSGIWSYRENDRLCGIDPYSASKGCAEIVARSYIKSYFNNEPAIATARAGNIIGGGDWAEEHIMAECARAWLANRPARLDIQYDAGTWQHILDPLSGYLWLGARLLDNSIAGSGAFNPIGQSYNFGPAAEIHNNILEGISALKRFWRGFAISSDFAEMPSKSQSSPINLCCDKALNELNWKPVLCFEEAMRYTAEWYSRFHAGAQHDDMWKFTQGQINAYINAAQERELAWALV